MNKKEYNKTVLKEHRKELRNHSTTVEVILWNHLKGKKIGGFKFRRQYSIANYIVDFYCTEKRLAIELDGAGHFTEEGKEQDNYRDQELKQMDIKVLRFENKQIEENIDEVLKTILTHLTKKK